MEYEFKKCSDFVKIFPYAKFVKPEVIEIGDYSMIDDFTFIYGGRGITIGRYVHIATFSSITGGGELIAGDNVVLAPGTRILTGTDTYYRGKSMSTALPTNQRSVLRGKVVIKKNAFIGANSVVHPNVVIGEGAIIGSNSLVLRDVESWSINVGSPCKKIKERPKIADLNGYPRQ